MLLSLHSGSQLLNRYKYTSTIIEQLYEHKSMASGGIIESELLPPYFATDIAEKYDISERTARRLIIEGSEHEFEHTKDPATAETIASQHIWEDENYYTKTSSNAGMLNKKKIKSVKIRKGNVHIYAINGTFVRNKHYQDFTQGGHYWVSTDYHFIPKNEIWIDDNLNEIDRDATILHEMTEYELMRYKKMSYEKAHDKANQMEKKFRKVV